jgi:outer membrane protein TolC
VCARWVKALRCGEERDVKLALAGLCFVVGVSAAFPDTVPELLAAASSVNPVYVSLGLDRELAELKLEKSRIEAKKERDLLSAEATYLAAMESQRKSLLEFCNAVIDAVFDAAAADVDVRTAALSEAAAAEDEAGAGKQHERGLLSEEELANAGLKHRSASLSAEQAAWALEDARRQLRAATGLEWRATLVPGEPDFALPADPVDWTRSDLGLRKAEIALQAASLDMAALPGNAAPYDRRIAEAALKKATMALEQARQSSDRSFRSAVQTLQSQKAAIALRRGETELQRALLADAERRYQRGAIARGDRDQQQVRVWTAEKAHLQAVRSYLRSLVSYLVSAGADPREAL